MIEPKRNKYIINYYNLLTFNQDDMKHLNRQVSFEEIEMVIKPTQNKSTDTYGFTSEFFQTFK